MGTKINVNKSSSPSHWVEEPVLAIAIGRACLMKSEDVWQICKDFEYEL
jgi:hypothetical protein